MKKLVFSVAMALSTTAFANPVETLNAEAVRASLPASEIQVTLDSWYSDKLENLEITAQRMNDKTPLVVRRQQALEQLDSEYERLRTVYGL